MVKPLFSQEEIAKTLYRYDSIATDHVALAKDITDIQIKQFWEQGYLIVDQLIDEKGVSDAIQAVGDIIHQRISGPRIQIMKQENEINDAIERELAVRKLHKFIDYSPALHRVCFHEELLAILRRIYGENPRFLEDQAILKPPSAEAGMEKPWHQDMAYGNLSQTKMVVGVWIALDEAGLDNGCMHIIPRSHMYGPIPHYSVRDWQLCDSQVAVNQDLTVPLKPGGALFFSGLLHHGTPPNFSARRRRALQFHFAPESSRKLTPEEYKMMFTNEVTKAEC